MPLLRHLLLGGGRGHHCCRRRRHSVHRRYMVPGGRGRSGGAEHRSMAAWRGSCGQSGLLCDGKQRRWRACPPRRRPRCCRPGPNGLLAVKCADLVPHLRVAGHHQQALTHQPRWRWLLLAQRCRGRLFLPEEVSCAWGGHGGKGVQVSVGSCRQARRPRRRPAARCSGAMAPASQRYGRSCRAQGRCGDAGGQLLRPHSREGRRQLTTGLARSPALTKSFS